MLFIYFLSKHAHWSLKSWSGVFYKLQDLNQHSLLRNYSISLHELMHVFLAIQSKSLMLFSFLFL